MANPRSDTFLVPLGATLARWGLSRAGASSVSALTFDVADTCTVGVPIAGSIINTGTTSLAWSITPPSGITVTPSSGTLAAGATQALSVNVPSTAGSYSLTLVSAGATISGNSQVVVASVLAPTTATLSGSGSAITSVAHADTVTLDRPADVVYTVTWSRTGTGASGTATSTIGVGQTSTSGATSQWSSSGAASVDFTISPTLTRAGRPLSVTVADAGSSSGILPSTTTLTSSATGTLPFTIGQPFVQGALAPGATLAGLQLNALTYWPDGSIKHGLVSGMAALTSGVPYSLAMTLGSPAAGSTLTTAQLKAALTDPVGIDAGAFGSVSWSGTDWDAPFYTWATGPVMSSWIYRKALPSDTHLTAWLEVRLFSTGAVEVFPWVENGYLTVASPTNKSATFTFTMGGTSRFSAAIDVKHHTRIPLLDNATGQGSARTFSHWLGTDPGVVPAHDTAYMRATKLVPNVTGWGAIPDAQLDSAVWPKTYTPNSLANDTEATGAGGGSGGVICYTGGAYLASNADVRAWKALMTHGLSAGSWPHHLRDESTNYPLRFSSYPNASISEQHTPVIPTPNGPNNYEGGYSYTALSHMPSWAYVPFLVTGRWWFLEELHFMSTMAYLYMQPSSRYYSDGFYNTGIQVRMRAWAVNALAQSLSCTPSTHPLYSEFLASWQANTDRYKRKFVDGTLEPNVVHPQGFLGSYSNGKIGSGSWWERGFMHNYHPMVWGESSNLGLPQGATSLANHTAVRDQVYKTIIQRADDGLSGRFCWRAAAFYDYPIGNEAGGSLTGFYTAAESWTAYKAWFAASDPNPALGGTLQYDFTTIVDGSSGRTYLATALQGAVLAVEHGAPGALPAYQRLTSASNYRSAMTNFLLTERPDEAVVPRPPAWLAARLAGMAPGDWLDASSTTNVGTIKDPGPDGDAGWLESLPNYAVPEWSGKIAAFDGAMVQIGSSHSLSSESPAGTHSKSIKFDLVTGQFTSQWNPLGVNIAHVYDANGSRALNGYIYRRPYNDTTLYRADVVTLTWTSYADLTSLGLGAVHAMDVFPTLGTEGSIIFCSGNKLCRLDIATGNKTVISAALSGVSNDYTVCSYHPGIDAIICGGGLTTPYPLYKLTPAAGGTLTQLTTTAPGGGLIQIGPYFGVSNPPTILVPDPLGRACAWLYDFGNALGVFRLDLNAGTWGSKISLPGSAPGVLASVGSVPNSGAVVVWDGRGRASGTVSNSKLWIHKVT